MDPLGRSRSGGHEYVLNSERLASPLLLHQGPRRRQAAARSTPSCINTTTTTFTTCASSTTTLTVVRKPLAHPAVPPLPLLPRS